MFVNIHAGLERQVIFSPNEFQTSQQHLNLQNK